MVVELIQAANMSETNQFHLNCFVEPYLPYYVNKLSFNVITLLDYSENKFVLFYIVVKR